MTALREILLRAHTVDPGVLQQAEQISAATAASVVNILVHYRIVDSRHLARLLSRAARVEFIDVTTLDVHRRLLQVVPREAAMQLRVLPIGVKRTASGERLYLAMSDPTDDAIVDIVEKATQRTVEVMCCDENALIVAIERLYGPVVASEDAPIVVGALTAGSEFLTDSTSEALRIVDNARGVGLPEEAVDDDGPTLEMSRQTRPASVALAAALAEVTSENLRRGRSLPTIPEVTGTPSSAPFSSEPPEGDESLFDEVKGPQRAGRVTVSVPTTMSGSQRALLQSELLELVGDVDLEDDAVAACRNGGNNRALVLLGPKPQSALLRALLDLEEQASRPRVVILGGDPSLRMLAFIDHTAELPDASPRAVAIAVLSALQQVGVML